MALIDVSELLDDPDFVDPMEIIDRTSTVNSFGQQKTTECKTPTVGSIQPASGKDLMRLPEGVMEADMLSFWVRGKIVTTAPGKYTSILVWRGNRYQVKSVADWSNYGDGYSQGICVAERPSQ